jgi:hypothetical protein
MDRRIQKSTPCVSSILQMSSAQELLPRKTAHLDFIQRQCDEKGVAMLPALTHVKSAAFQINRLTGPIHQNGGSRSPHPTLHHDYHEIARDLSGGHGLW